MNGTQIVVKHFKTLIERMSSEFDLWASLYYKSDVYYIYKENEQY